MALSPSHWFGEPPVVFDTTIIPYSAWLDGTNDGFTRASGDFDAEDGKEFTIGTWFQPNEEVTGGLLAAGDSSAYTALRLDANGKFYFQTKTGAQILYTDAVYRDMAWYHIIVSVDTTQGTDSNRVKIYVNGILQALSGSYPNADVAYNFNVVKEHEVGNSFENGAFKGSVAQSFMIGSKSIQQSDFAITDFLDAYTFGTNGSQYVPKKHSEILTLVNAGSDNSFLLDYSNSGALGTDSSDFTNLFTATSIAAVNQTPNTPSLAYPIMHPFSFGKTSPSSMALTLGNNLMTYSGANSQPKGYFSSQAILSTDNPIYFEYYIQGGSVSSDGGRMGAGLFEQTFDQTSGMNAAGGENAFFYRGSLYDNGTDELASNWTTAQVGEIQNFAYKPSTGEVWVGVEGTWRNGAATDSTTLNIDSPDHTITASKDYFIGMGAARAADIGVINFGNNSTMSGNISAGGEADGNGYGDFAHAVPSGFYSLASANRVKPTYQGIDYFNTVLYTGNGTAIGSGGKAVTGANFEPGLVWIKNRDTTDSHMLFDRVRTATKYIETDSTDAEATDTESLTAFGTDGFTVGDNVAVNTNTEDYVSWNWGTATGAGSTTSPAGSLASTSIVSGADHFSVVSYTGTGAATTVGHGLGAAPELIIVKNRDAADAWQVYHSGVASDAETDYMVLNTTAVAVDNADRWNDTAPTSSVFSIGDGDEVNTDTEKYIAYCFRSVPGVCKVGKYLGNGNASGPLICTEFKPRFLLVRNISIVTDWNMRDTVRDTVNTSTLDLAPNSTAAEPIEAGDLDILSNGFKIKTDGGGLNGSGNIIIYLAMAEIGGGGALPPIYGK